MNASKLLIVQRVDSDAVGARIAKANERTARGAFVGFEIDELEFLKTIRDALNDAAERPERVLALDARAWIYPSGLDLRAELDALLDAKTALFSADVAGENFRWNPGLPNAGQFYLRRGEATNDLLDAWIAATEREAPGRLRLQRALWKILPRFKGDVEIVADYWRFAARRGYLIRNFYVAPDAKVERELNAARSAPQLEPKGNDENGTRSTGRADPLGELDGTALDGAENESASSGGANDAQDARRAEPADRPGLAAEGTDAGGTGNADGTGALTPEPTPEPKKRAPRKRKTAASEPVASEPEPKGGADER